MTSYIVHVPADGPTRDADLMRAVLVKDRFHWLALLAPALWLLAHRVWLGLLGYVVLAGLLAVAGEAGGLPQAATAALELLLALVVGVFAPDLRSWALSRRGYEATDVVTGRSLEEAERHFFARAEAGFVPPARPMAAAVGASRDVIGLFPSSGSGR